MDYLVRFSPLGWYEFKLVAIDFANGALSAQFSFPLIAYSLVSVHGGVYGGMR
jgi:hypothetical protein